ncbi:MAG: glycosyltransferase family 4 protein [Planctomycetota bacterium]
MALRVCVVGGIYDKPPSYRSKHAVTPETTLADGLARLGMRVSTFGHRTFRIRKMDRGRWDIVHVHHFGRGAILAAAHAGWFPFVFTTHDSFRWHGLPVHWRRRLTDVYVLRHAHGIVALSSAEERFLARQFRLANDEKVAVVPNGWDWSSYPAAARSSAEPDHTLLFVGQLRRFKGLQFLIEALPLVRRRFPRVRLVVAYHVDAGLEDYRSLARRAGVAELITFAGPQSLAELAALYSRSAVVVVPSLAECLCSVVTEAMYYGAAIVATDVGGVREQLGACAGVIVPPADAKALAEAISQLLGDPELRRQLGERAHAAAVERFSSEAMIQRHLDFYRAVRDRWQAEPAKRGLWSIGLQAAHALGLI